MCGRDEPVARVIVADAVAAGAEAVPSPMRAALFAWVSYNES